MFIVFLYIWFFVCLSRVLCGWLVVFCLVGCLVVWLVCCCFLEMYPSLIAGVLKRLFTAAVFSQLAMEMCLSSPR